MEGIALARRAAAAGPRPPTRRSPARVLAGEHVHAGPLRLVSPARRAIGHGGRLHPRRRAGAARGFLVLVNDVTEMRQAELIRLQQANADLALARDRAEAPAALRARSLAKHEPRDPHAAERRHRPHVTAAPRVREPVQSDCSSKVADAAGPPGWRSSRRWTSKIEAGRIEIEETDSLRAVLESARWSPNAPAPKGLALMVDAGDAPDALRGDPTRIAQALPNLAGQRDQVHRARQHRRLGGRGRRNLTPPGAPGGFTVRDTGIGIEPAQLARCSTPSRRSTPSTTRRFGGSGLELAITRRLAVLMAARWAWKAPRRGQPLQLQRVRVRPGSALPMPTAAAAGGGEQRCASARPAPACCWRSDNLVNQDVGWRTAAAGGTARRGGLRRPAGGAGGAARRPNDLVDGRCRCPCSTAWRRRAASRAAGLRVPIIAMTGERLRRGPRRLPGRRDGRAPGCRWTRRRCSRRCCCAGCRRSRRRPHRHPPAPEGGAAPVIDAWTPNARCATSGLVAVYRRILRQFADLLPRGGIAGFEEAVTAGDGVTPRRVAHSFKGAAGTIGSDARAGAGRGGENLVPRAARPRKCWPPGARCWPSCVR